MPAVTLERCPLCGKNYFRPGYGTKILFRGQHSEEVCSACAQKPLKAAEEFSRRTSSAYGRWVAAVGGSKKKGRKKRG